MVLSLLVTSSLASVVLAEELGAPGTPESHGPPEASASRKLSELLGKLRCKVLRPFCETGTIKYRSPPTKTDPLQHLFLVTKRNSTRICTYTKKKGSKVKIGFAQPVLQEAFQRRHPPHRERPLPAPSPGATCSISGGAAL